MYLKVSGCWTGGHQEDLSTRSININIGMNLFIHS